MSNHPAFFFWSVVVHYRFGICHEHEEDNERSTRREIRDRGTNLRPTSARHARSLRATMTRFLPATLTRPLPAMLRDSFEKSVAVNFFQIQIFEVDVANMAT